MRIPKSISSSVFLCIILTVTSALRAQLETGQIAGTVMDQTGAAVPNAAIAIKNLSTNMVRYTASSSGMNSVP
jgi:hypothetical protein